MSDAIGPLTLGKKDEQIFLGRDFSQHQDYSKDSAIQIDQEIKRIVTSNYDRARETLEAHKRELTQLAEELLVREVLDADQVKRIASGQQLEEPVPPAVEAAETPSAGKTDRQNDQPVAIVLPVPSLDKAVPQE